MKPFTLLTFLLLMGVEHVVAQSNYSFQLDSISIANSFQKPSGLDCRIEYNSNLPELLSQLKESTIEKQKQVLSLEKDRSNGVEHSMPCYQPEGDYPALIFQPDTTIKYSLLIKDK
ncbi:hypothetical protein [Carboxylicivirga linearis]|uniref:Uncharacterized protein n=1 Tax=Carboxylicivirga linearis TaxID=1628157 RepID=A0ABS5JWD9_9BACT|nr:hypothetical protein [Carboxylicivirga linearis]MBS2099222.1 hypothetical protein [Carboxylicivirga linearis]